MAFVTTANIDVTDDKGESTFSNKAFAFATFSD